MKTKKLLGILLALVMVVCLSTVAFAANDGYFLVESDGNANYGDQDEVFFDLDEALAEASEGQTVAILSDGEYTLSGEINVPLIISCSGEVTLNLSGVAITAGTDQSAISVFDGNVKLNVSGENTLTGGDNGAGIYVAEDASVTIQGTGTLTAVGNAGVDDASGAAGIGGTWANGNSGAITIDDAAVVAKGYGVHGSGIGSGSGKVVGEIKIVNGAKVTAYGGYYADGVGTKLQSSYGKSDPEGGAAIGGGGKTASTIADITITNSTVTAYGGSKAAGIGANFWSSCGNIAITNSTVTAQGGSSSAGIGTSRAGDDGVSANITISGGTVTATGGDYGAGIGGGYNADSLSGLPKISVTISNAAEVEATGGMGGAAIGGGYKTNNLEIAISDTANVTAVAGEMVEGKTAASGGVPCAIGSGANGSGTFVGSYITIAETATVTVETVRGDKAAIETVTTTGGTNSIPTSVTLKEEIVGLFGSGTEADPYLIKDLAELKWFRDTVNTYTSDGSNQYKGKYVKLTADIDLAGENWNPIGSMTGDHGSFKGVFDGNNHTISNLNCQQAGNGLGLFARTAGNAEIKNLTLNNVTVKSTDNSNYVGGVVGNSYASTKITNVHVTGTIDISGRGYIGGISGHGYVVMDNVSVKGEGTISSTFWCAGGILGYGGEGATNITNASVEGTGETGLTITSAAGGLGAIVGMAEDNNGTQPISGSDLSAKNVKIKTYIGAYGDAYANYALGYLYGGNETSILTGTNTVEDVVVETSTGDAPTIVDAVASVNGVIYFNLEDALAAVENGDTLTLLRNVDISKTIQIAEGKTVTIDLNGKVIDGTENCNIAVMSYGNLTVKDSSEAQTGAIKAGKTSGKSGNTVNICAGTFTLESGSIYSVNNAILIDEQAAVINIKGGTITAEPTTRNSAALYISSTSETTVNITGGEIVGYNGILLWNNTTINMTGGSIDAKGSVGIQGNGNHDNTKINISGTASVAGYYAAIYHPQAGTLTIADNATLTGWTGVVVKGGNVAISGGTISGTGAANTYYPVSSGFVDTGDGLYIEHYDNSTNSEHYGTPTVTVTGGTFTSTNGKAVASYANTNNSVEALAGFITGGSFNTDPTALCADGYAGCVMEDGTYGVVKGDAEKAATVTITVTTAGATVELKQGSTVIGSAAGTYNLPGGTYTYTVSKPGYYTEEGTITVAGKPQTVTVSLAKLPTLYTINKAQCENGKVTAQAVMAAKGSTIKVSATPAEGYKVWTLTVTDAAGNEIEIVDGKITMPASNITVSATFVYDLPFEDVADDAENYPAIAYMYANGLMIGTSTEQYVFDGDVKMTRSQIAQILYRLAGEPAVEYAGTFTDVAEGKWYTEAIEWAASKGIMVGVGDGTFAHNRQIKVVEMSALIYRYAQCQLTGECTSSDWATESAAAMTWCVENGVLAEGTDGTAIADRDLAAEMFYNVYNLLNK